MRKVIHSNFELDLSNKKITDISENPIFSDKFSTKYSYPIEIDIEDDIDIAFGFISFFNSSNPLTYIDVMYVHDDVYSPAILEVEEIQGRKMQVTISWGFEEFPSWNKKLSELSLDNFEVDDIYEHAKTIVPQTFPAVNYNFPQIHTKKFDGDDDLWFYFENIINNYKNGNFVENYVDTVENIIYNKNILQPLVYLVHVLQRGFADGNHTLSGTFIEHSIIKKIQLYSDANYFNLLEFEFYSLIIGSTEYESNNPNDSWSIFNKTINISPSAGYFVIIGTVSVAWSSYDAAYACIKINNQIVWEINIPQVPTSSGVNSYDIEIPFILTEQINTITFYSSQANSDDVIRTICSLDINPVFPTDGNGNPIPNVFNPNIINLTKVVPDITFGELITQLKNWFNLNLLYEGNNAILNFTETDIDLAYLKDYSMFEIKEPLRKLRKGFSYLLKFQDINSTEYKFLPVFHSVNGVVTEKYKTDEKTSEIQINGYPLPVVNFGGITTAHAFEEVSDKLQLVIYDGLTNGLNLAKNSDELLLPNIHTAFWKKWFDRRINSHSFQWTFIADSYELLNKGIKDKINCYSCNHLIRTMSKTQLDTELYEVEIETEAEI